MIEHNHLTRVGETYWQHLSWCLYSAVVFAVLIPIALIHGVFPFLLANVPDRIMTEYVRQFRARRVRTGQEESNPE
jgi:hypothetical protein